MAALFLVFFALPRPAAEVEAGVGAAMCGANGAVDCAGAGTGIVGDLRGAWLPTGWLGLGAGLTWATLPAEGVDAGTLLVVGPEVLLRAAPTPSVELRAALSVGFDRIAGVRGQQSAFGAVGLRLGGRYRAHRRLALGLDYGLTRPRLGEVCADGACAEVTTALLHRISLVVGVPFW